MTKWHGVPEGVKWEGKPVSKANYSHLEIMAEVAWQVGDILGDKPRAESRWLVVDLAKKIIEAGIISPESEDIDETIAGWLDENYWEDEVRA